MEASYTLQQPAAKKNRIFGLDILRVICALLIFMRHSITMYGCSYGHPLINEFILATTSPVMTCFFIISGFSLFYTYERKDLQDIRNVLQFYLKRVITVYPTYLLIHILWCVFMEDSLKKGLILTPVDVLGIQTMYDTLFGILHNGGTWFISCLIFAYFVYPLLQELMKFASTKVKVIIAAIVCGVLVYSYYIVAYFGLASTYSNPVYRCFEFAMGVIIAAICKDIASKKQINSFVAGLCSIIVLIMMAGCIYTDRMVSIVYLKDIIIVPLICVLLISICFVRNTWMEKNKLLVYCSSLSYYFFILQLILWKVTTILMEFAGLDGNREKIFISFVLCVLMSIMTSEIFDKPIKKLLSKKLLK